MVREVLCCEMCDKWTPDWVGVEKIAKESLCVDCCRGVNAEVEESRDERFFYYLITKDFVKWLIAYAYQGEDS
jgi:hypothetical protein